MNKLNKEQREFLEYVRDKHASLGWGYTIDIILGSGSYDINDYNSDYCPSYIIRDFKGLLNGVDEQKYGKPTKYLKG